MVTIETLPLTAIILTMNEEKRVGRCLKSLAFASKVVVIDSFSTDQTRAQCCAAWNEIGRAPEDLIFVQKIWQGFTKTRNESIKWVQTPWVFWVDADEWVTDELRDELKNLLGQKTAQQNAPQTTTPPVYKMPRLSIFLGREIRHGGWYPDRKARLGRTGFCEWKSGPNSSDVHEDLCATQGTSTYGFLKGHLGHEPFLTREEHCATNDRYSTLLAEGLAQKLKHSGGRRPSYLYILIKTGIKFIENWVFKLGILDGYPGFVIARGSAQSLYWRLMKVRRLLPGP